MDSIRGEYDAFLYSSGLKAPNGIALHPLTSELYVAEQEAGRISVIRSGGTLVAIDAGWTVLDDLPKWAITPDKPLRYWLHDKLRRPDALAFSHEGHLYVTEDIADGRLLQFIPDENGHYRTARAIPIPWFYKNFAWEGMAISRDGRLFLAGSAAEAGPSLFFGVVLMRDPKGDWWVVDYGPFAGFSCVSLSREEDILIIGEEVNGSVTWWDTLRHRAIGTVANTLPNLSQACILPHGAIAVAVRGADASDGTQSGSGSRVVQVDPQDGRTTDLVSGFQSIEGMLVSPKDGYVYVADSQAGQIVQLRPHTLPDTRQYLLENTVRRAEMAQGLPPKKWPPFLKGFFRDLGVSPRDEVVRVGAQGQSFDAPNTYTLVEVGKAIPLIAGQVRTELTGRETGDPITDIDFIVLFPNRSFGLREEASPGLAFFSARHASGKTERTYSLENLKAIKFSSATGWQPYAEKGSVFLPTATCAVRPVDDGLDISLAFVSLHGGDDYYLQLHCGDANTGTLVVDSHASGRSSYGVDFTEETMDGAAYNTLVVAGFSDKENDQPGWLNIGNWPMGYSINPEQRAPWTPYSASGSHPMLETLWGLDRNPETPDGGIPVASP